MNFESLGLNPLLTEQITTLGYTQATAIQLAAIPVVLKGRDVMASAQTGTGKTAAFALPLLHQILLEKQKPQGQEDIASDLPVNSCLTNSKVAISVLVLTPTRELAQQVHNSFEKYSVLTELKCVAAYGGASINPQITRLGKGCDVLIATPGRLQELLYKELVDVSNIKALVLDEADRMLDMGFIVDIKRIQKSLPQDKQTLLFSATFSPEILGLAKSFLHAPERIEVDAVNATATQVEQLVYQVDKHRKSALLSYLIGMKNWHQVLIFTRTKQGADELAKEMKKDGITTDSIHGDKSQGARERILSQFKEGKLRALVATDLAARGIDIKQLQYVINHELPYNSEDYIHRIGRTGRAGMAGLAVSLVSESENYLLADIEKLLGESFIPQWLEGFEPERLASTSQKGSNNARGTRPMSKKAMRAQAINGKDNKKRRPHRRR
jgi:ATP-dependent RNA helicase RhlE